MDVLFGSEVRLKGSTMDDVTKNRLLVGGGLLVFGGLFWYIWKHGKSVSSGPAFTTETSFGFGPFDVVFRKNKVRGRKGARSRGPKRNPVIVAARKLVREFGMKMGDAVRTARKAKSSMPGHPSGQAIFAEVRLKRRGGKTASMKAGSGSRFKATVKAIMRRGIPKARAQAIAAAQARKSMGARYFAELAQIGKAKARAKRAARRTKK